MKRKIALLSGLMMCANSMVSASELSSWAEADYDALSRCAIITEEVMSNKLNEGITRKEICAMLANFYERLTWQKIIKKEICTSRSLFYKIA